MMTMKLSYLIYVLLAQQVHTRIHRINITNDSRKNFPLSTFGFNPSGGLLVIIKRFQYLIPPLEKDQVPMVGFSLQRSTNDNVASYTEKKSQNCIIGKRPEDLKSVDEDSMSIIFFKLNVVGNDPHIAIERHANNNPAYANISIGSHEASTRQLSAGCYKNHEWLASHGHAVINSINLPGRQCTGSGSGTSKIRLNRTQPAVLSGGFAVNISCSPQAGLYNLYFHNCGSYPKAEGPRTVVNMEIEMVEHNTNNYLSVGDIPLPLIYGLMSIAFLTCGIVWICIIRSRCRWVFKVHWLMTLVVFIKSGSVGLNAINYHLIGKCGLQVEAWAVLFYVVHLLKGALMFAAILLIGTGYFFVKHVLSSKEKKLFAIVIPLQIFANIAQIIIDETEEGYESYKKWNQIFLLVDLICCGAILLPVIWSIKHLQEASKTDGKAVTNLEKLKLFRQFYVLIVVYIYFTRIIIYLIRITVPFQFMWVDELFMETANLLFFILTGYKFRPADDNPYIRLQVEEEEEIEMDLVSEHSGLAEGLTRVNRNPDRATDV